MMLFARKGMERKMGLTSVMYGEIYSALRYLLTRRDVADRHKSDAEFCQFCDFFS